jgi:hypothetical protein
MRPIKESVLLKTSSGSDVQDSGGVLTITGLNPVNKKDISAIKQVKYKTEVDQVYTIGAGAAAPVASTLYSVAVYDPNRVVGGYEENVKKYSFTTPATLTEIGATAALQREYINGKIVAAINADASNRAVAASLGGGAGFTITDDGGYYPVKSQSMTNVKGPNVVDIISGYGTDITLTTAAVYSSGVGAILASMAPVIDAMTGNLISGSIDEAPLTTAGEAAVSGQNYDAFVILSLKSVSAHNVSGQLAYQPRTQTIWVDNGTGNATTNLAGFISFERAMLGEIFELYAGDKGTIYTMGNNGPVCQGLNTGLPSGTAQAENVISFGNGFTAHYSPIATSTLVALVGTNDGIGLVLDATAAEGVELSAPTWANSQKEFVVGKTGFSCYAKVKIDDVSGLNPFWFGFRKKEAYNATWASYTDYAAIGLGNATGDVFTTIELNGGGNTNTDTTKNWADNETHTMEVRVTQAGVATFYFDGIQVNTATSFTFDPNDSIIPTFYALQTADLGTPFVLEFAAIADNEWRS